MTSPLNPNVPGKRGAMSPQERKYIQDNWMNQSDEVIGKHLGRNSQTVEKYRKKRGWFKTNNKPQINIAGSSPDDKLLNDELNRHSKVSADKKFLYWIESFKLTPTFRTIKDTMMDSDLEFFIEQWALYHVQLEDMTASEEDTLELLITLRLRLNNNQRALKQLQLQELDFQKEIDRLENSTIDVEHTEQNQLRAMIISNNKLQLELNKEYRELTDRYNDMQKLLNVTREQREQKQQVGGDTFLSLIRQFTDADRRREAGKYNELTKIAARRKLAELKMPHIFLDQTVEPIVMDGIDYLSKQHKKEVENKEPPSIAPEKTA